jgi:hypothetical protein
MERLCGDCVGTILNLAWRYGVQPAVVWQLWTMARVEGAELTPLEQYLEERGECVHHPGR